MKQKYQGVQMRFPAETAVSGMEFSFRDRQFRLGEPMPQTLGRDNLPIAVIMNGYTMQFELLENGQKAGAGWFYFYGSFEGKKWAVLDEVELMDAAVAA